METYFLFFAIIDLIIANVFFFRYLYTQNTHHFEMSIWNMLMAIFFLIYSTV